jgi:UDP-2,3-diacylglucosamine hydrolase
MSVLFISDLHLAPERPAVTRAFLSFLRGHAAQAKALYILGDLFEAWVGDDDPTELAAQVQTSLAYSANQA